jgi:phosphohistidine phosphatase
MHLCFLRHGHAEKSGVLYNSDQLRPLSAEGRNEIENVGRHLKRMGAQFDMILSSPLLRARQTAEIIAEACGYQKPPRLEEFLGGRFNSDMMAGEIEALPKEATLLMVGHAPSLDKLIAYLLSSDDSTKIVLQPGGLAWIETEIPTLRNGVLHWLIPAMIWESKIEDKEEE